MSTKSGEIVRSGTGDLTDKRSESAMILCDTDCRKRTDTITDGNNEIFYENCVTLLTLLLHNVLNFRILKLFIEHKNQSILSQYHEIEELIKTKHMYYHFRWRIQKHYVLLSLLTVKVESFLAKFARFWQIMCKIIVTWWFWCIQNTQVQLRKLFAKNNQQVSLWSKCPTFRCNHFA